jgi:hypothetical protein
MGTNNSKVPPQGWDLKGPKSTPSKNNYRRVDLSPADFDNLLDQKGVRVNVFRTMFCPNVKSIDGAEHNINCTICNGSGFLDARPICTRAFIQNQALEKLPFVEGMVDGNSVAATFPVGVELQYFTLVTLTDFTEPYFQRVKRQEGSLDVLKYQACRVHLCIDENGKEYFQDSDFALDVNGSVVWKVNKGPDTDIIYSIHYESAVQFRATRAMHSNRFTQVLNQVSGQATFVKLPEQWLLTKEFLVKRVDKDNNEILPNKIHPKTDPDEPEED